MGTATENRIELPRREDLTPEQADAYERIAAGPRGRVEGPLAIWLHSPELANRAQMLGEFARYKTTLEPRLSELAILTTARHWTSHFEWAIHATIGEKAGLDPSVIASIKVDAQPEFAKDDERIVHAFASELLKTGKITGETLGKARKLLGDNGSVELSAIVGYYSTCAFAIALAEPVLPDGSRECLPPKRDHS